jgi:hypothetical protein
VLRELGAHLLDVGERPKCCVLATGDFEAWYDGTLPFLTPEAGSLTPDEEVDTFLRRFMLGKPITEIARLQPTRDGVWEIKLHHTRLFGWFVQPDVLVLDRGDHVANVKSGNPGYDHHFDAVVDTRKKLGLDYVAGDQTIARPCKLIGWSG